MMCVICICEYVFAKHMLYIHMYITYYMYIVSVCVYIYIYYCIRV